MIVGLKAGLDCCPNYMKVLKTQPIEASSKKATHTNIMSCAKNQTIGEKLLTLVGS